MGPTHQSISDQRHGNLMEVFVALASGRNVKWERSSAVSIPGNVLYNCYQIYLLPRNTQPVRTENLTTTALCTIMVTKV